MSVVDVTGYKSRLDDLRVVTLTDGEVWSARDLMPFVGYDRWENFSKAINRAIASVNASGLAAADHFRGVTKMVQIGSAARRQIEDVEITRHGCSILFQNSDGSKPEIAAIQQYFAVQTRKQEIDAPALTDDEVVARAMHIMSNRVKSLEARVTELVPVAAQAETFREADGLRTIGDLANDLKVWAASNRPTVKVVHKDVFDQAGRMGLIIRGETVRHNQPTARAIEAGWVKPKDHLVESDNHGNYVKVSARLTPRGYGRLWDGCVSWINSRGSLDASLRAVSPS